MAQITPGTLERTSFRKLDHLQPLMQLARELHTVPNDWHYTEPNGEKVSFDFLPCWCPGEIDFLLMASQPKNKVDVVVRYDETNMPRPVGVIVYLHDKDGITVPYVETEQCGDCAVLDKLFHPLYEILNNSLTHKVMTVYVPEAASQQPIMSYLLHKGFVMQIVPGFYEEKPVPTDCCVFSISSNAILQHGMNEKTMVRHIPAKSTHKKEDNDGFSQSFVHV